MLQHMGDEVRLIKESHANKSQEKKADKEKEDFDLSNEDIASSFVYEENYGEVPTKISTAYNEELIKKENSELKREVEKSRIEILDRNIQLNKTKSDKFILYNELNELVMSLRRIDVDKLNSFYKKNTENTLNKNEMPIAKGIKFNVLSAQSQLCKMMITDSITKKLNFNEEIITENNPFNQMDVCLKILKKNEEDFDSLLDKKLAKKTTTFLIY